MAAGIVKLSRYRGKRAFRDPFCGSGTIVIEAALAAINRAPGLGREFAAQAWSQFPPALWEAAKEAARAQEYRRNYDIWGGDIDPKAVEIASRNARKAGVDQIVQFQQADATRFLSETEGGIIAINPPYGERLLEKREAEELYRAFGQVMRNQRDWNIYVLSSHEEFEQQFGRKADKKRKLYNGMIKCNLYQYYKT